MKYELFFFKENNRYIDIEELFRFFSYSPFIKVEIHDDEVLFLYNNSNIGLKARFIISKMSKVPDIYRLNPKYLDLDIRLELDPMLPNFKLNIILDIVAELCQRFNFACYNVLFEDVSIYRKDLVIQSYEITRDKYKENNIIEYKSLNFISKDKLTDIFKYLYEKEELIKYYESDNLFFPEIKFLKSRTTGRIYVACQFEEEKLFVFPPRVDLIYFKLNGLEKVYYSDEVLTAFERYTYELPGFGRNTKVLDKIGVKKSKKILNHIDFTEVCDTFEEISKDSIIDFK